MIRRKLRRKQLKKRNRKILILSTILISILSIGYGAFQTVININATGKIQKTDFYVSNIGSDTEGNGTKEKPYLTIEKAYEKAGKKATIYIMTDIRPSKQILFDKEKTITITSYSENSEINKIIKDENYQSNSNIYNDYMISIKKGTLQTKNIIVYGSDILYPGGALLVYNTALLKIQNETTISNFKASDSNGSAIRIQFNGSRVTNKEYDLLIEDSTIKDNYSSNNSGAVFVNFDTKAIIKNGNIVNNSAEDAGAININGGQLDIYNSNISYNNAKRYGGAFYTTSLTYSNIFYQGILNIYGKTTINNNNANISGAIYIGTNSIVTMNDGTISHNTATTSNGGIYKHTNGTFNKNGGIICENTPSNEYETHPTCPN